MKRREVAVAGGSNRMVDEAAELNRRIEQRAMLFVLNNIQSPTPRDFMVIENAMRIGAMIKGEVEMDFDRRELEALNDERRG
jgi:hypothetical protein